MPLGSVKMPGSEEDGERRQQHGNVKSVVLKERQGFRGRRNQIVRILQDGRETGGNRFQLQSDVGHDAEDGNDGDQSAQYMAFAVARGNEVSNRGNAMGLADAHHFQQHIPPQCGHQCRTEIDRQEADAAGRGAPDAAVNSPGRAVHRQRQRIDIGVGDDAAAGVSAFVAVVSNGEQQADVKEGDDDDQRAGQHVTGPGVQ